MNLRLAFTASIFAFFINPYLYGQEADAGAVTEEGAASEEVTSGEAEAVDEAASATKKKKKKMKFGGDGKPSVDNRVGKKAFAAVELVGLTPDIGFGLRGGYFLTPDAIVGLSYFNGGFENKTQTYQKSLFEVTYKRFFTNSLYADAGLGYQSWTVDYKVSDNSNSTRQIDTKATLNSLGLVLHVGNQWQWRAFTAGCDWAGYFLPVSKSEKFPSVGNGNQLDREKEERAAKRNTKSTAQLLRFYAGYSF